MVRVRRTWLALLLLCMAAVVPAAAVVPVVPVATGRLANRTKASNATWVKDLPGLPQLTYPLRVKHSVGCHRSPPLQPAQMDAAYIEHLSQKVCPRKWKCTITSECIDPSGPTSARGSHMWVRTPPSSHR